MNRDVAHALYDLRTAHGLTQTQLAALVGTKQPVIARLEDADYEGHSLSMLSRVAAALHQRIRVALSFFQPPSARSAAHCRRVNERSAGAGARRRPGRPSRAYLSGKSVRSTRPDWDGSAAISRGVRLRSTRPPEGTHPATRRR